MKPRLLALTATLLTSISRPQPVRFDQLGEEIGLGPIMAVERDDRATGFSIRICRPSASWTMSMLRRDAQQRLERAREGQQVGEAALVVARPGEMLGDEERLERVDQPLEPGEMAAVGLGRAGEAKADAVQRQRPRLAQRSEHGEARPAVDHVIFGMDFEPQPGRRRGEGLVEMDRA